MQKSDMEEIFEALKEAYLKVQELEIKFAIEFCSRSAIYSIAHAIRRSEDAERTWRKLEALKRHL